ncbi:snurportin-1 [Anthonomus grandis grandis]|uniref:snurportin-1 n=1 Tax=Anthonomus grandis grandis TaxID=2921223 RepID=UPI002165E95A|nr:snurportin-1 [Anthonomus grandis grandis]
MSTEFLSLSEEPEFTSEFAYLYKKGGKNPDLSQQERRDLILQEQKEKRHNLVDQHRDFTDIFLDNDEDVPEESDMDVDAQRPKRKKDKFHLMFSEYLTDIPDDLEENWLVKIVPNGCRALVLAKGQQTMVFGRKGKLLNLRTHLPGGGLHKGVGITALDCIFNKSMKTIFVLDCMFWNTMSMINSETTFRFYWIRNQFSENPKFLETNKPYKFYLLDFYPAQKSLIQDKIFQEIFISDKKVLYSGVTFYHKEVQYAFRQTPLMCWLYSYMLPEKLGVDVPQELMDKMPKKYENLEKFLKFKEEFRKNRPKNQPEKIEMDTT